MTAIIVLCHVPLDVRNGAGMRVLNRYLASSSFDHIVSVHFGASKLTGDHAFKDITYLPLKVPKNIVDLYELTVQIRRLLLQFPNHSVIALPNGIADIWLAVVMSFFSPVATWFMDDCTQTPRRSKIYNWLQRKGFAALYRRSRTRIVISDAMKKEFHKRYNREAEFTLCKSWPNAATTNSRPKEFSQPLQLVFVGSFVGYYTEPLKAIANLLREHPDLPIEVNLYSQNPPEQTLLVEKKIFYKGGFADEDLLKVLSRYDVGLLSYSFDVPTVDFMQFSFPSKLVDYLASGLPVLTIASEKLAVFGEVSNHNIGLQVSSCDCATLLGALQRLISTDAIAIQTWQENSIRWSVNNFSFQNCLKIFHKALVP